MIQMQYQMMILHITKLSKENIELIKIIQSNDRLSDKLCPELVKLD